MTARITTGTDWLILFGLLGISAIAGFSIGLACVAQQEGDSVSEARLISAFSQPLVSRTETRAVVEHRFRPATKLPTEDTLPEQLVDLGLPMGMDGSESISQPIGFDPIQPEYDEERVKPEDSDGWLSKDLKSLNPSESGPEQGRKSGWGWLTDAVRSGKTEAGDRRGDTWPQFPYKGESQRDAQGVNDWPLLDTGREDE